MLARRRLQSNNDRAVGERAALPARPEARLADAHSDDIARGDLLDGSRSTAGADRSSSPTSTSRRQSLLPSASASADTAGPAPTRRRITSDGKSVHLGAPYITDSPKHFAELG